MKRKSHGQSLVEFALIMPVFVFLIFALLDFGRVIYIQHTLAEAAREATRTGIASPANSTEKLAAIRARALSFAPGTGLTAADITGLACTDCFYPDGVSSGSRVVVVVRTRVNLMTPVVSQVLKGYYDIESRSIGFIP